MKLLVCSTAVPHGRPHSKLSASLMILYHYLAELKKGDVRILHVILCDPGTDRPEAVAAYRAEMEEKGKYEIAAYVMPSHYAPRRHTWEELRPAAVPEEALAAMRAFRPDLLFCFEMQAAALLQDFDACPKSVQVHDLKFLGHWFHTLYALRERPATVVQLPVNWLRARQWRGYYLRAMQKFDNVHSAVASSAAELRRLGIPARYIPYAWPRIADVSAAPPDLPATPTFLFLGNLSGLGSRSALHFLFFRLYPHLVRQWGNGGFSILVCGANAVSSWITENIARRPEMRFLGFVGDVEGLMRRCHGVIAPIDVKTGNRSRILTAMSLKVPVVAHTNTALGNPALVNEETCFLSSDGATFAAQMRRVFEGGPDIHAMVGRAERMYEEQFAPPSAARLLWEEFDAALHKRRPFR